MTPAPGVWYESTRGVLQTRRRLRLGAEPRAFFRTGQDSRPEHLEGDDAFQHRVPCPVHNAHATAANFTEDSVFAQLTRQD